MFINLNLFKKFDVALSFAEENRPIVERVARLLQEQGIKVFYDDDHMHTAFGKDLKKYLDKTYRLRAKFCVVFVSEAYERKLWTKFEIGSARARALFQKNKAYVLPYLLDDSSYTVQFKDVVYLTRQKHGDERLVEAIKQLLDGQLEKRLLTWFQDLYRIKRRLVTAIVLLLGGGTVLFKDNFTPINSLADSIYKRGERQVNGAICKDSSFSFIRGQGACSHHGGIDHILDSTIYDKTMEQSRKEAEKISWLPP